MIIIYLKLLMAVLIILFIGLEALILVNRGVVKFQLLESLAIAYALGSGILTSFILFFYVPNLPTSFGFLFTVILIVIVAGLYPIMKFYPQDIAGVFGRAKELFGRLKSLNIIEGLLIVLIGLKTFFVFAEAMIKPVFSWDAVANHSIRAKALYLYSGDIIKHYLTDFRLTQTFTNDYPMQRSILEAWFYKCMGAWNDQLSKIMYPLMFFSIIIIFYYVLRRRAERPWALFFTFLLTTIPMLVYHSTLEYVDLSVCFYFTFASFFLYLWYTEDKRPYFLVSAVFAGILPTVKAEGLALMLVLYTLSFLALLFTGKSFVGSVKRWAVYFAVSFPLYVWWFIFRRLAGLQTFWRFQDMSAAAIYLRFVSYLQAMNKGLFMDGNWGLLFPVLLFVIIVNLVFNFRTLLARKSFLLLFLLLMFLAYLAFVYSCTGGADSMGISINRVCLGMAPLALLILADQFMILKDSALQAKSVEKRPIKR